RRGSRRGRSGHAVTGGAQSEPPQPARQAAAGVGGRASAPAAPPAPAAPDPQQQRRRPAGRRRLADHPPRYHQCGHRQCAGPTGGGWPAARRRRRRGLSMYLKRSITGNWGTLPEGGFEYGPVNLFSGGNGAGKTTAADALQTLMTAAHDNLYNYTPGQDDTTQRGRGGKQVRTLASYVLGCDDGAFARPLTTDGYIAGIFHPTQGETAEP